jgi:alpha-L-fucosidase
MSSKKILAAFLFVATVSHSLHALTDADLKLPISAGSFTGTMESLTNYSCPEWFRDAKFGIWAHWGPQAVPEEGDWYARKMYISDEVDRKTGEHKGPSSDYKAHLERFGHPSTNGWKDIIPLWKAEKWEPEKLMALYKKAGAKYFVSMGSHHDDFFLWNSKLHRWNSVQMGPHRDVVGEWQKAAKENGLPFGVSEHLGASFTWFQDAHKSDKTGPFAGVPYDGANSNYWDLYHFPAEKGDNGWYSKDPRWHQQWYDEIKELVDNYQPDLLYSDGGVAFGPTNVVGLSQVANLYNVSAAAHGGKSQAVYNCKQISGGRWVQDYERGVGGGIDPSPWQTDTSIGDWFYNKHYHDKQTGKMYGSPEWVARTLVDIVSKNGNLLLNVVLRPDGSLDADAEAILNRLVDWTAVNGEAIYGSRPWLIFGEGAVKPKGGAFNEKFDFSAKDIRFTTQGKTLYAIALGWPADHKILIHSLAQTDDAVQNTIQKIELLGHAGELKFSQTKDGLAVEIPADTKPDLTCALRVTGENLKPAPLP